MRQILSLYFVGMETRLFQRVRELIFRRTTQLDLLMVIIHTVTSIDVESSLILVGANVVYTVIAAICAACVNINKVSRVKYWKIYSYHS